MHVRNIIGAFLYPEVKPIEGTPTYKALSKQQVALNTNATSISSTLGSSKHGLLTLTLSAEAYKAHSGCDFTMPSNPGTMPAIMSTVSAADIEDMMRKYDEKHCLWKEYQVTDTTLKQQLLGAITPVYLSPIGTEWLASQMSWCVTFWSISVGDKNTWFIENIWRDNWRYQASLENRKQINKKK